MRKCVAAGVPAGVIACAAFSLISAVRAQEAAQSTPPPPEAEQSESDKEAKAAPAGPVPLPDLVVTTDKKKTKKKAAKKEVAPATTSAGGGDSSGATQGSGSGSAESDGVVLGGTALSDTGTTVFDSKNVQMRTDGSGDANTFLRNLPNVQFQNDIDDDPGVNLYELINTRPLELSISGAQTYENNFILNGVSISNVTGPVEPHTNDDLENEGNDVPNLNAVYGMHSQTVFVPSEFIGTATIIDSNASAEYGQFQGGVVLYDLARPPTDRYHASVIYSRHTDDQVNYILATPTGTNPLDRVAPTFTRENLAASVGAPITPDFGFIIQASRKTAETVKQKEYKVHGDYGGYVQEESQNIFLRAAAETRTDIGRFTLDTAFTDYSQIWESDGWQDLNMDAQTKSSTTRIEYLGDLPDIAAPAIGLGGVTLKSTAFYNDSNTINDSTDGAAYAWVSTRRVNDPTLGWIETFHDDKNDDWCRPDPIDSLSSTAIQDNTMCYQGGYDDKETGQTDIGLQAQLRGDLLWGRFLIGGEAKSIEGRRARPDDFVYYSTFATASGDTAARTPPSGSYDCDGADACTENQFARTKIVSSAFSVEETVTALHGYAEVDQTLDWFNFRTGVRVDYEDYFKNVNVAPRLVGTITVMPGLSVTGGYNRYYLGESLYYALRDSQPYSYSQTRGLISGTDTVGDWNPPSSKRIYGFKDSDLTTPFHDEYTGTVRIVDPLLGGHWRIRYLERYGREQFASESCGSGCKKMTNDAESFYRSASAEYTKFWRTPGATFLDAAGISFGATWSEQSLSKATYVDDDESDEFIWYKEQSYTKESFTAVSGNLDIPIRLGATVATSWFADRLWLSLSAGYNLGYEGVYDTGDDEMHAHNGADREHDVYEDRSFGAVLQLDLDARYFVTEQAYINVHVNNLLNTAGNAVTTNDHPWIVGRSVWVETGLRF